MWQAVCSDCCACLRFLPEVFAVKGKKNYRYQSDKVTVDHWYCVIIFTIRHLIPVPSSSHNIIKDYSACGALFVIVAEKHTKMMQVDLSEPRSNVSPPPLSHSLFLYSCLFNFLFHLAGPTPVNALRATAQQTSIGTTVFRFTLLWTVHSSGPGRPAGHSSLSQRILIPPFQVSSKNLLLAREV